MNLRFCNNLISCPQVIAIAATETPNKLKKWCTVEVLSKAYPKVDLKAMVAFLTYKINKTQINVCSRVFSLIKIESVGILLVHTRVKMANKTHEIRHHSKVVTPTRGLLVSIQKKTQFNLLNQKMNKLPNL